MSHKYAKINAINWKIIENFWPTWNLRCINKTSGRFLNIILCPTSSPERCMSITEVTWCITSSLTWQKFYWCKRCPFMLSYSMSPPFFALVQVFKPFWNDPHGELMDLKLNWGAGNNASLCHSNISSGSFHSLLRRMEGKEKLPPEAGLYYL